MQDIALENNLSETAFFVQDGDKYHIRWFTPTTEVDLCGHATLASAFVIFNVLDPSAKTINFTSLSGDLPVTKTDEGYMMDFPVWSYDQIEVTEQVTQALGSKPIELYKGKKWIALFDDEKTVRDLSPDMERLKAIKDCNGVLPTAQSKDFDFISRNFAPQRGIPEDPVTGSAHCMLAPFWADRLSKTHLNAYQASKRGGILKCKLKDDRVEITGDARMYMKGNIYI